MKTGFGMIGLGNISNRFATVLGTVQEAQLVAVAARNGEKAAQFAEKHHAKRFYDDYDQVIHDDEVDVIYIGLTHNFHFEMVKKCLENHKAVICEKPLVLNRAQAEELIALAKKKETLLIEAMWTRFLPAFQKAREWVTGGAIGKAKLVQASFSFDFPFQAEHRLYDPALAGGSLYDAGVYPIEFAIGILDETPSLISGIATTAATGVDDFVAMSLGFPSGALATLSCGVSVSTSTDAYIYGSEGHVVVYNFLGTQKCERFDKDGNPVETFEGNPVDGFVYQIREACRLYREGALESELISHRDSLACAEVFTSLMSQFETNQGIKPW